MSLAVPARERCPWKPVSGGPYAHRLRHHGGAVARRTPAGGGTRADPTACPTHGRAWGVSARIYLLRGVVACKPAATGAVAGRRGKKQATAQAEQVGAAQAEQQVAQKIATFKKAMSTCLEGKGYSVK